MADIRVTDLRPATSALDLSLGIRARFDCVLGPVVVENCLLKIRENGRAVAVMPKLKHPGASLRMASDRDHHLLSRLAGAAYGAIAGAVAADDV